VGVKRLNFKDTLPTKAEIFDFWKSRLHQHGIFIDWGEPGCWACGFHYKVKYDIKHPEVCMANILQLWNRIPLQRCHIVPRALGGTDNPNNLFLMCRECHDLAPNTTIPEIFYEWAKSQSWCRREASKIRDALASFDTHPDFENDISSLFCSEEFQEWLKDKCSSHRPQSNYAPISSRLTPSTFIGLAVYYWRSKKSRLILNV
jgi:hypothetical protein